ncbi:hypothetical protein BRDID11002_47200 [Bradyrhizobium diazoefficiens]
MDQGRDKLGLAGSRRSLKQADRLNAREELERLRLRIVETVLGLDLLRRDDAAEDRRHGITPNVECIDEVAHDALAAKDPLGGPLRVWSGLSSPNGSGTAASFRRK